MSGTVYFELYFHVQFFCTSFHLLFLLFAPLYLTSKTHFKIEGNRTNHGANTITKGTPSPLQLLNTPPLTLSSYTLPLSKMLYNVKLICGLCPCFRQKVSGHGAGAGGVGCVAEATKRSAKPIKRFFARRPDRLCLSVCPSMNCKCPAGGQLTIVPAVL